MTLKVVTRKVDDLIPYINNARIHNDNQVTQIASSIKEFGWTTPILVDGDNGVIAGHGRLMAAKKLGMNEVPVIELTHLTEIQKKALILADNKIALNSEWDADLVAMELDFLKESDFDIELTGFSLNEKTEESEIKSVSDEPRNLIMIELISERECEVLFTELQDRGFNCKVMA